MANPDLNALFDALLEFAKTMLSKYGEFHPFGATMSVSGEIAMVGAAVEGEEFPPGKQLVDLLTDSFRNEAASGELIAAGICYDGLVIPPKQTQKTDAVCCCLEHQNGETVNVFSPYKRSANGDVMYGEIFATKGELKLVSAHN